MADARADSVDVVGYSAGGVVARLWVEDHDGGVRRPPRRHARLPAPRHATSPSSPRAWPRTPARPPAGSWRRAATCSRALNAGDETPAGPRLDRDLDDRRPDGRAAGRPARSTGAVSFVGAVGLPGARPSPTADAARRDPPVVAMVPGGARHQPSRPCPAPRSAGGALSPSTSLVVKFAQAAARNTTTYTAWSSDAAHDVAPQDRVAEQVDEGQPVAGRQVRLERARPRPGSSSSVDATRTASAPERGAQRASRSPSRGTARSRRPRACRPSRRPARSTVRSTSSCVETCCPETLVGRRSSARACAEQQQRRRRTPSPRPRRRSSTTNAITRDQLGDQQPGAADRPDQQVAQRARLGLAGDRLAGVSATAIGRNSGSTIAERGQREQRAVGEHRRQERRPGARAAARCRSTASSTATSVGQRVDQQDASPRCAG